MSILDHAIHISRINMRETERKSNVKFIIWAVCARNIGVSRGKNDQTYSGPLSIYTQNMRQ